MFGSAEGSDAQHLNAVIRQAILEGYIERGIENYGILRITDKGRAFLKHPKSFRIVEDGDFAEEEEEPIVKAVRLVPRIPNSMPS